MTTRITQQELESYLWGAVLLRGLIDAGDYKQCKRPVSDKPCYPDRVWEALVGGGLSIVTGLASGSNSSNLEFGQVGSFSRVSLSQAKGSRLFSLAVPNKV